MSQLFHPNTNFDMDLSNWDISNVTNMYMIFHSSGLSTTNYDNILNGWAQQDVQMNVELGAETINYCNAADSRNYLMTNYGWGIGDAGSDCSTASLEDKNKLNIIIYPNPGSDIINLKGNKGTLFAIIYNMLGKKITELSVLDKIDVSHLKNGIYFITLSDSKNSLTYKFIKN